MRLIFGKGILAGATFWLLAAAIVPVWAANKDGKTSVPTVTGVLGSLPNLEFRVHRVGNIGMTISNLGVYGYPFSVATIDPETGMPAPLCQFPNGSGIEYLFGGALWVGAVVDSDTLVSTGFDGWQFTFEMYPGPVHSPDGSIVKRSTRPNDSAYSPYAVSDADYIATFYDTLTDPSFVSLDPYDGRPHTPLGLKIVQESYSWNVSVYEDFILFRYRIKNIGGHYLHKVHCGLYFDCDIGHSSNHHSYFDDISGSYSYFDQSTSESVFVAWSADDDGDPTRAGQWDSRSARGAIGVSLLNRPANTQPSFNWWVANICSAYYDWGPVRAENYRPLGTGGLGTPAGDRSKYFFMRNHEIDYDQLFSAVDFSNQGWLPPLNAIGWCEGNDDTRFLLSFGALDLAPGDSTEFAFVVAMGDNFHRNPTDFYRLFDWNNPQAIYDSLDFSDLTTNILAARQLYRRLFVLIPGDADRSGQVNVADAIYLINYLFLGGPVPNPPKVGDTNGDCRLNIADVVYLISYLFRGGVSPAAGCIE
jgi:hypothetical protein